jgi:hypothetical protein
MIVQCIFCFEILRQNNCLPSLFQKKQMMKREFYAIVLAIVLAAPACAQIDFKSIQKQVNKGMNVKKPLSQDEIVRGLKEALTVGSNNSSSKASALDGYLKNPAIKIPFPPQAKSMEEKLRAIGLNKQVDEFVTTLNRAAETAAKDAAPIFVNAITQMSITDGMNILKGSNDAATVFLRNSTQAELKQKFLPVVKSAIEKVEVTRYWNPLMNKYNQIPFVQKQNPDLNDYVTTKALEGLFILVADEELKIRQDPAARVSEILRKVFGK